MAIYTMIDCSYETVASLHEIVAMIGRKVRRLAIVHGKILDGKSGEWQDSKMAR